MSQASPGLAIPSSKAGDIDPIAMCSSTMLSLEEMLQQLDTAAGSSTGPSSVVDPDTDQLLAERRLGNAAGLYVALRCKHAATAAHCLHVALLCSAWAQKMDFDAAQRNQIELAALLHDIGIIGIPDRILRKPSYLESHELGVMAHARRLSEEILQAHGAPDSLLAIIRHLRVWYNATDGELPGTETPPESRMIAIAEAFDSMTTEHVFRSARSKEQAVHELMRCSGTQFDPVLVEQFLEICGQDLSQLYRELASQWLKNLRYHAPQMLSGLDSALRPRNESSVTTRFLAKILETMQDCVIMVDPALNVIGWNQRAEELTRFTADSIAGEPWRPEILQMWDDNDHVVSADRCPLRRAIASAMPVSGRYSIVPRNGGIIDVEAQAIPVVGEESAILGAAMLMRDISSERSLERMCENLHTKATLDPLTQLPNRSEFDRVYTELIRKYHRSGSPFSLMICDLDHFKEVNDKYGHQAGDEVLQRTSVALQKTSRSHDLVARYGGEEFVIVCPDCEIATATHRAEQIRDVISRTEHAVLGKRRATVSIGVTQIQSGDTAESLLRRADRALYQAKDQGRNRVIQLGTGVNDERIARRWLFGWPMRGRFRKVLAEEVMVTPGPITFVLEKLRGYVADHDADIRKVEEDVLELEMKAVVRSSRWKAESRHVFRVALTFSEQAGLSSKTPSREPPQIQIRAAVFPAKRSGKGSASQTDAARQLAIGVRAYLMARRVATSSEDEGNCVGNKILLPKWPSC